jgi:hypothetical protein
MGNDVEIKLINSNVEKRHGQSGVSVSLECGSYFDNGHWRGKGRTEKNRIEINNLKGRIVDVEAVDR